MRAPLGTWTHGHPRISHTLIFEAFAAPLLSALTSHSSTASQLSSILSPTPPPKPRISPPPPQAANVHSPCPASQVQNEPFACNVTVHVRRRTRTAGLMGQPACTTYVAAGMPRAPATSEPPRGTPHADGPSPRTTQLCRTPASAPALVEARLPAMQPPPWRHHVPPPPASVLHGLGRGTRHQ